jgi:hypothetical protein
VCVCVCVCVCWACEGEVYARVKMQAGVLAHVMIVMNERDLRVKIGTAGIASNWPRD